MRAAGGEGEGDQGQDVFPYYKARPMPSVDTISCWWLDGRSTVPCHSRIFIPPSRCARGMNSRIVRLALVA